jgi:hypothetical protein
MLPVVFAAGIVATAGDVLPPLATLLSAHGARLSDGRAITAAHMRIKNARLQTVPLTIPLDDAEMYLHIAVRVIHCAVPPLHHAGCCKVDARAHPHDSDAHVRCMPRFSAARKAQLKGDDAKAALVADAAGHLAAQDERWAALKAAFEAAGLGAVPKIHFGTASVRTSVAQAVHTSLEAALLLFARGPSFARERADMPAWTSASIAAIVAKGTPKPPAHVWQPRVPAPGRQI